MRLFTRTIPSGDDYNGETCHPYSPKILGTSGLYIVFMSIMGPGTLF